MAVTMYAMPMSQLSPIQCNLEFTKVCRTHGPNSTMQQLLHQHAWLLVSVGDMQHKQAFNFHMQCAHLQA